MHNMLASYATVPAAPHTCVAMICRKGGHLGSAPIGANCFMAYGSAGSPKLSLFVGQPADCFMAYGNAGSPKLSLFVGQPARDCRPR